MSLSPLAESRPPARIDHVNVVVADMELSMRFYGALFDMDIVLDAELEGPWYERVANLLGARARCVILASRGGGLRIELLEFRSPASYPVPPTTNVTTLGLRHFAVQVDDIARHLAIAARFVDAGVEVVEVPASVLPRGKRMCYLIDPDGAMIELAQYGTGGANGTARAVDAEP